MISLDKDLQTVKSDLVEFGNITKRILRYLPNLDKPEKFRQDYRINMI